MSNSCTPWVIVFSGLGKDRDWSILQELKPFPFLRVLKQQFNGEYDDSPMVFGVPYCQTKPFFVASNEIPKGHSALKTAGGHTECHAGTRAGGSTKWDDTSIPVSNSKIDLMQE